MKQSYFEQLGGELGLRVIINDFIERLYDDVMIGFLFRRVSALHLKEMEYQFAAEFLGAPIQYGGRDLNEAHAVHHIRGGQFARRSQILSEVLDAHHVPSQIKTAWLEHTEKLKSEIISKKAIC